MLASLRMLNIPVWSAVLIFCPFPDITVYVFVPASRVRNNLRISLLLLWNVTPLTARRQLACWKTKARAWASCLLIPCSTVRILPLLIAPLSKVPILVDHRLHHRNDWECPTPHSVRRPVLHSTLRRPPQIRRS